ncbi:nucleic acid-binding, OB-fold protein [Tanacetum coccineum]
MNMGQDRQIHMINGHGKNQVGQYAGKIKGNQNGYNANVGNQNGLIVVPGIAPLIANQNANYNGNGNVVVARAEGIPDGNLQHSFRNFDVCYHDPEKCEHAGLMVITLHGGNNTTRMIKRLTVSDDLKESSKITQTAIFHCKVRIANVRKRKGWNFPSCRGENCKKGTTRRLGQFWCESYNKSVEFLVLRYRLELDVADETANAVVVMFDEPATTLVGCSVESVMEDDDETIVPTEGVMESASSSTLDAAGATESPKLKRLTHDPFVPTPSKPLEERPTKRMVIEDSDEEDNCGSAECGTRKKDHRHSNKKTKLWCECNQHLYPNIFLVVYLAFRYTPDVE